jgi:hypothetical protein
MTKRRRTKGTGSIYTRKDGRVVGEYEVNGKLKDETDLEALNDDLVGVVAETMQPEHVGLWLRSPQDRTMQSKLGESEVEDV